MTAVIRSAILHVRTPLYLNAYALMLSNLLSSALGLVYWTLAARLYPVEAIGASSALISSMVFLTGVSQLNMRVALTRLVPEAGRATARLVRTAYASTLATTFVVSALVFGAVAVTAPATLLPADAPLLLVIPALVAATMVWTLFNLQDGVMSGLRRTVWVPVENALYSVGKIVLLLVLAVVLPAWGVLISWFVPMAIATVVVTIVLSRRWIPAHEAAAGDRTISVRGGRLLRLVASDFVASLFALAGTALLPVLVVATSGPAAGAYFYIVWTVATSLNLVPVNMAASLTVETVAAAEAPQGAVRTVFWHLARLLVPLVLAVVVGAPLILEVFGRAYAQAGTDALRLLALAVLPYGINYLFIAQSRVEGRGRDIVVVQAALALATLGLSFVLIPVAGIAGVASAWLASQSLVAVVLLATRLRHVLHRTPAS